MALEPTTSEKGFVLFTRAQIHPDPTAFPVDPRRDTLEMQARAPNL